MEIFRLSVFCADELRSINFTMSIRSEANVYKIRTLGLRPQPKVLVFIASMLLRQVNVRERE